MATEWIALKEQNERIEYRIQSDFLTKAAARLPPEAGNALTLLSSVVTCDEIAAMSASTCGMSRLCVIRRARPETASAAITKY